MVAPWQNILAKSKQIFCHNGPYTTVNPCLAQRFFFKSLSKHLTFSAAVFPEIKWNLMPTLCSFKPAIEKSTKTMTEAQEKITGHIHFSSSTLRGQLMQRAATYTHPAGAGGTNAPPEKNSRYFWVPLVNYKRPLKGKYWRSCGMQYVTDRF